MKYYMKPEVMNDNLKGGLGRWIPAISSLTKSDPWWMSPEDPHRAPYVKEGTEYTRPSYNAYNPAWAQVQSEQLMMQTVADVVKNGMSVQDAVAKAFKRSEVIFTKYTFG